MKLAMVDLKAAVELIRPVNCLMIGLAVVVGEVIGQRTIFTSSTLLGFMTGFLLGGASMVNNDYLDRNVDAVNAPSRPLPSGRVSPSEACMLMILLSACGLVLALLTSLLSFFIAVAGLIVFLLYNYYGKKLGLIGNMMVSVGTVLSLLYGAFLGEDFMTLISSSQRMSLLALFGLMVFLSNTGREVN
ncbi:MAG: UbiA family prenyltransferase, partial [Candidatus Bathyarchaeia archaeon]